MACGCVMGASEISTVFQEIEVGGGELKTPLEWYLIFKVLI